VARDQYREFVGYARWFYGGNNFDLLQCIWPDHSQRFPWHPDFPAALQTRQPLRTDDSEWKFNAGKNRAVFTTKPVINQRLPILRVSHDVDGDWQFLCGTTNQVADGALVRLSTIIRLDPTILELGDMPAGWRATRPAPGQPWRREATSDV
jgi:hypothetical protein